MLLIEAKGSGIDVVNEMKRLYGNETCLFNWALGQGDDYGLDHSPCDRLKPKLVIGKKLARKRVLDDDKVRSLWRAGGKIKYPFGPMFRLLLLTGQRKSEVSDARSITAAAKVLAMGALQLAVARRQ
jgi:integrase